MDRVMPTIPMFSIIGFSGSGKTTLLVKLIAELKGRGLRVAVIKHDAHEFDIDHEGKDSWRFTHAGADVTAIVSSKKMALIENRAASLDAALERIKDVDIILTEGYKSGDWPKIAVWRAKSGKPLPVPAEQCVAIATDVDEHVGAPRFGLDDIGGLADFLLNLPPSGPRRDRGCCRS